MTDLFGQQELRALSWKEPYAALMLQGKMETRTWSTNYRGKVLICASKMPYSPQEVDGISGEEQAWRIIETLERLKKQLPKERKHKGHAIAIGDLVDCRLMRPEDEDYCFVQYRSELYCHIYTNVRAIKPIPFKGVQGWKKLGQEFMNTVEYL